jgi:anaerobic selenocysteine-containing dehydrogenase
MEAVKKIRTACRSCHGGCGVIAHVKDGKVIKVEGDPNSPSATEPCVARVWPSPNWPTIRIECFIL